MSQYSEIVHNLIQQANGIEYRNDKRDAVIKRAEMIIRKIFDNKSPYLITLSRIRFSPIAFTGSTSDSVFENSFNNGKKQLLNLLNVIAEDIELDDQFNLSKSEIIKTKTSKDQQTTANVFIVHGHNEEMKLAVARTIEKLQLIPIILHEQANKGRTIIEKFTDNSNVMYAIILLSGDDIGYSKNEEADKAKYRARQNVILELGYFIGTLGRERVLALHEIIEDFEIPSDYTGVSFVPFDKPGKWQYELVKELKALGIKVDANKIL